MKYLLGLAFLYLAHLTYQDYRVKNFSIENATIVFNECSTPDKCENKSYKGTIKMYPKNRQLYVILENGHTHTGKFVYMRHNVNFQ